MKTHFIIFLFLCLANKALCQFFYESPPRVVIPWKGADDTTLGVGVGVEVTLFPESSVARSGGIFCGASDRDRQADFLQFNASRRYFNRTETINSNRPIHVVFNGPNHHSVLILTYDWEFESVAVTNLISSGDSAPGKTDVYIGFRDYLETAPHYGWAHLRRASTNAGIAFFPVDWAVNPFPGQPIRAGEPPDLPQLTTVIDTTTDPANPALRVSWPAGFPGVKLQVAPDLTPPVQWLDQELSAERLAVLALPPDGTLFFRLVWAGP
jgi:hypothetical protein